MDKFKRIIPLNLAIGLIIELTINCLTYFGTRLLVGNKYHHNITTAIDDMIPLVSWTILIYWGCYVFWGANYILGCRQDEKEAYRFLSADFFAKVVCLIVYLVFPTTNTRPEIVGTGLFDNMMVSLYQVDAADNLFPSIHCLTSWFCCIAIRKNEKIPKAYKYISVFITIAICISTLTTKQHVAYDVIGGVALAEIAYQLVDRVGFTGVYRRGVEKIGQIFSKKN